MLQHRLDRDTETRHWIVCGKVQGVGFRPFIYQLADKFNLQGWVRNNLGEVEIFARGKNTDLDKFHSDIKQHAPAIAEPSIKSCVVSDAKDFVGFHILESQSQSQSNIHIPTDFFICPECLKEMHDVKDRRYLYPFTNCTQCGPRYTLIESLPYDRRNTSMLDFKLCNECQQEYGNPSDRRFHAEPVACPNCGPELLFKNEDLIIADNNDALHACVNSIHTGNIVAVKGIGGYHLICDANNSTAIAKLRKSKGRPHKPLAVMFPPTGSDDLLNVSEYVEFTTAETELLRSPSRPIVIGKKTSKALSSLISPELDDIGAMLAYSPLHHLLLNKIKRPLIATSANISGEPVLTKESEVERRLIHITKIFLHHNRRIVRPADDSVFRTIAGRLRPIRLARGHSPIEFDLPFTVDSPVIACGGQIKSTIAMAWDNRMVISPHIGELVSPRSMDIFEKTIKDFQALYQVNASLLICDAHPNYASSRWADKQPLPVLQAQHHKAHASALVLEYWEQIDQDPCLVFTWDGTGFGEDGSLWGSEAFYGQPGNWKRMATFRPFRLPGGEKASSEPWRSAAALCWEANIQWDDIPKDSSMLKQAWAQKLNSPRTTAMGRLFDAASALTGVNHFASFEGQAPMLLEQKSDSLYDCKSLPITTTQEGIFQADWAELIPELLDKNNSQKQKSSQFHSRIANTLLRQVKLINQQNGVTKIGLSGGVFQNRRLTDYIMQALLNKGYQTYLAEILPVNDAGISAGQIVEASLRKRHNSMTTKGKQ